MHRSAEASTTHVHMGMKSSNNDQSTLPYHAHHGGTFFCFFKTIEKKGSKAASGTCQETPFIQLMPQRIRIAR